MQKINESTQYVSTQLTAPGNASVVLDTTVGYPTLVEAVATIAAIDTSLVLRLDFSDVSNFASGVVSTPATTLTANGSYTISAVPTKRYMRAVFVSEAGGTAATVDFTYNLYR